MPPEPLGSLAGVGIYIEQDSGWIPEPRYAEIDVLDSSETILHHLSTPSHRRVITATIWKSPGSYATLVQASDDHEAVTFSGDVDSGQVYIRTIEGQRIQNIAGDSAADRFVMRFTAELTKAS